MPAELRTPTRILTWTELRQIIPLSRQHVHRLEKAGKFPRRLRYSPGRVGWISAEVEAYVQAQAALRETGRG
ncbi:helix-turn-helix transcriptional regulator [Bradyrhizobium sp.]|uniref:helix-turn-helix transcriptional regulator n=1 Tax=Bradyrhizobium sp. TaxID=376 RepID=UPI0039E46737